MHDVMSLDGETPPPSKKQSGFTMKAAEKENETQTTDAAGATTHVAEAAQLSLNGFPPPAGRITTATPPGATETLKKIALHHQPQQGLLREWHRRGNPFQQLGENSSGNSNAESVTPTSTALNSLEGGAGGGRGSIPKGSTTTTIAGVGLGRLPAGTDVDDDPDEVAMVGGVSTRRGEEGGGGRGRRARDRGGGNLDIQEELEAEEKR